MPASRAARRRHAPAVSLLDLICPTRCEGCGEPGRIVCARCGWLLATTPHRHWPSPCPAGMPPVWIVAGYEGPVRQLLLGYKERGAIGLAPTLAACIAATALAAAGPVGTRLVLVPVPSSRAAVRRRGDDVVELLAHRAARLMRSRGVAAVAVAALAQGRAVPDSAGLSASRRAANLRGALRVDRGAARLLPSDTLVVVDDLVTTGATVTEATRALESHGWVVRAAVAVAATRRRHLG
jgi:predicted amidophosphoribosyltransferase